MNFIVGIPLGFRGPSSRMAKPGTVGSNSAVEPTVEPPPVPDAETLAVDADAEGTDMP
jgi:hypothetical protein